MGAFPSYPRGRYARFMAESATAGDAVTRMLRDLAIRLRVSEGPLRRDEFDAVHQTRILVRRLRSLLKAYEDVLNRKAAREWRAALKTWGDALGGARDAEVRARDGERMLAQLPAETADALRPVLVEPALEAYRQGHDALLARIRSAEHAETLRDLELFTDEPDLGSMADLPATHAIGDMLVAAAHRVRAQAPSRREVRAIRRNPEPALEDLHELRKAARQLRYAAEAAVEVRALRPRARRRAEKLAASAKEIQDVLGDHRDAVLFAAYVDDCEADDRRMLSRIAARSRSTAKHTITRLHPALRHLATAARGLERV